MHPRVNWTRSRLIVSLLVLIILGTGLGPAGRPASAASSSATGSGFVQGSQGVPNVDIRTAIHANLQPGSTQTRDLKTLPSPLMQWNNQWGEPSSLISHSGYLTLPSKATPEAIARKFLADHAGLFRLSLLDLRNYVVASQYVTQHNGVTQLTLQQRDQARDVYGAVVTFTIDRDGRIVTMGGLLVPGAAAPAKPALTAAGAVTAAGAAVGASSSAPLSPSATDNGRLTFPNTFARKLSNPSPITAELITFPMPGGLAARLGWKTVIEVDKAGWYESVVDAVSGQLLFRRNYYQDAAEGNVYVGQNPNTGSQQVTSFAGAAFDNAGWVTDRLTSGNNVNAYQDLNESNSVGYQPQTPASPDPNYQHFDYTFSNAYNTSGGTDVTTDRDAVITQLFYYVNFMHDYLYGLGFDEVSRNFQVNNFGRGGSGGDAVLAEADDGFSVGNRNNANFATPSDGNNPRMQMYVFDGSFPFVDGDMEADVVFHEYTHGLSNRLVGGGNLGGGIQTGAMGEGWSDWVAGSINNDPVIGEYVTGNSVTGIRRVAYDNSPWTYSSLCNAGCEVHNDGEIWATVLWGLRTKLQQKYGTAPGKAQAEQLIVDGMKDTVTTPSFLDARNGILAADQTDNAGANRCLIWESFAIRGMGVNASSSGDQSTVTPDTTVPGSCAAQFTYTGDTSGDYHDPATVSATLLDASALPIANVPVTLSIGAQSCSATTNTSGAASCSITPNVPAGVYPITEVFNGSPGYPATTDSTHNFTVTLEETTITSTTSTLLFATGLPATLTSQLLEDGVTAIAGRTVVMTLGSPGLSCSAVTDASGTASCQVIPPASMQGPQPVLDSFTADSYYLGASNNQHALTFSYISGGFTLGDRTVDRAGSSTVTWWAANWWQLNELSGTIGGRAPASFKGFAANIRENGAPAPDNRIACGAAFTYNTTGGNSSNPPGTVPAYMAVAVPSVIMKSGNTITGNIQQVVIVHTDPGYAPSPGSLGTGSIAAHFCP